MDGFEFWERVDSLRPSGDLKTFVKDNGLDYVRITNQRSDCRIPKLEDAYALAKALNVSLDYLVSGERSNQYGVRVRAIADWLSEDEGRISAMEKIIFGEKAGNSSLVVG